jgi:hypothetical protein
VSCRFALPDALQYLQAMCVSVVEPQTAISSRERRQPKHTAVIS